MPHYRQIQRVRPMTLFGSSVFAAVELSVSNLEESNEC